MIRDAAGRTISTLPAQERWTTFELLDIERRALAHRPVRSSAPSEACARRAELLAALRATPRRLSDEQARAVIQMTQSGNGVDVLTAPAGAGKTFAFAAARDAWERGGYRVIGAAHTGVAADELAMAAGIPSTTIARLLIAIDRGEPGGLDDRTVLVVDEAGTAGTRDLARLLDEVDRTGAKAVLVGDPKQLPEIAAGGLFAALTERLPTIELKDNRRQQHEWEIEALRQLRDGDTTHALHAYLDHGRITVGHDAHHTKTLLLGDWWASIVRGDDAVMLAGRRADVAELNMCGHVRAEAAGLPHRPGPRRRRRADPGRRQGDDAAQRPQRSASATATEAWSLDVDPDERTMRVQLARGVVDVPARYVDAGHVGHAYAMTVNKAHGTDVRRHDAARRRPALPRARLRGDVPRTQGEPDLHVPRDDGRPRPAARGRPTRPHRRSPATRSTSSPPASNAAATSNSPSTASPRCRSKRGAPRDLLAERDRVRPSSTKRRRIDRPTSPRSSRSRSQRRDRRAASDEAVGRRAGMPQATAAERRLPDVKLLTAASTTSPTSNNSAERLDREIAALHASQHRRASHLAAHQRRPGRAGRDRRRPRRTHPSTHQPCRRRPTELHHQDPRPDRRAATQDRAG